MKYHELPPDAGRVIHSLRDSGYNFNTAVADIVDNSIAAKATIVKIFAVCSTRNGDIRIIIADNGCGMDIDELCNALRYGSNEREDVHSLGKFGLGLKTASTSQCRNVILVSRKKYADKVNKLCLDIDHAERVGRWEYIEDDPTNIEVRYLEDVAGKNSGTAVIWEKCDRVMGRAYRQPGGNTQQRAFKKKLKDLGFHLSLVFSRFLDVQDSRAANVKISINGTWLKPFDPFALQLDTRTSYEGKYKVLLPIGSTSHNVDIAAYVVPSRDELRLQADIDKVFPTGINPDSMQGLYVYRENRLIHWGDWCGLYKNEFHYRLCRIALSFGSDLDDYFNVDFQKSKVSIDDSISGWLVDNVLTRARSEADARYRKGVVKTETTRSSPVHSRANTTISRVEKSESKKKFSVTPLNNNRRRINSEKGRSFVEVVPQGSRSQEKVNVRLVESLPDSVLWEAGLFTDDGAHRTYVEINTSHPFYQKAHYACGDNANAARCIDYLIWSLAEAEYATKDQSSLDNYSDMIVEVSRILRRLSEDLPDDEG